MPKLNGRFSKFFLSPSIFCISKSSSRKRKSNNRNKVENIPMSSEFGFPQNEWFYIKSQINGHVLEPQSLSVNSGVRIIVSKQRFGYDADSQLWKCDNGFLINRASGKVIDIQGGHIRTFHRTHICQFDQKPLSEAQNQRWIYLPEGYISPLNDNEHVIHVSGHFGIEKLEGAHVLIRHIKDHDSDKQKWIFEKEHDQPAILTPPIPFANDVMSHSSESSYFANEIK
ncbi:carbohydrate-binding module family 13 protein [Gigaspora margarita]|uniref:Carbohydrate-binding module family 13 protein n=1 Tax=Gigaspora margarita TaxID=4874 RepID=A0A8H4AXT2_GIGMA|nr:carbohydrate-binding module family 13 protein [Gigaspora margarita]